MRVLTDKLATAILTAIAVLSFATIAWSVAAIGRRGHTLPSEAANVLEALGRVVFAPLLVIGWVGSGIPCLSEPLAWVLLLCGLLATVGLWTAVATGVRWLFMRHR